MTESWVKEDELVVQKGSDVVFTVKRITTTGNGTRMVHLITVGEPHVETAVWEPELLANWTRASAPAAEEDEAVAYVRGCLEDARKLLTDMFGLAVDARSVVMAAGMIHEARFVAGESPEPHPFFDGPETGRFV